MTGIGDTLMATLTSSLVMGPAESEPCPALVVKGRVMEILEIFLVVATGTAFSTLNGLRTTGLVEDPVMLIFMAGRTKRRIFSLQQQRCGS